MKTTPLLFFMNFGNEIPLADGIVILLTLILILLGIPAVLHWNSEKKKNRLRQESMFKKNGWIRATDLSYSILDGRRIMQEEQYPRYQKGIKEMILKILNERKTTENTNHILLIGPSLSGKSHITTTVLNNLTDAYVLIPDEDTFSNSLNDGFEFPSMPKNAQYQIVLLDNFHEFFKGGSASPKALIYKAIKEGFTIWANCISLEEYSRVRGLLSGNIEYFKEIEMSGRIGESFYPPSVMIKRFNELQSDVIAKDVLLFIKQAYILGVFSLPYSMKIENIKKAFAKKYFVDVIVLMKALNTIEQKGFIKVSTDHASISFDSVWLTEVVEPELKAKDFFVYWNDIIYKNVVYYTNLIAASEDYSEALSYFNEMEAEGIVPDLRTYTLMISLSPNYKTALDWFDKTEKGKANEFTFSSLINVSPDYETAKGWYDKIETGKATTITYNTLMNKSPDYETAKGWYDKIETGKATTITYNTLINKSPDYGTAEGWYDKIETGKATDYTYNSLINKSPDYETAKGWYDKIELGKATDYTYNSLIDKSPDYEVAMEWFNKIEKGKATEYTYGSLLKVASRSLRQNKYQLAISIHDEMLANGICSNVIMFTLLISLSPDFGQAFKLLNYMITLEDKHGNRILPNERTRAAVEYKAYGNKELLIKCDEWFRQQGLSSR